MYEYTCLYEHVHGNEGTDQKQTLTVRVTVRVGLSEVERTEAAGVLADAQKRSVSHQQTQRFWTVTLHCKVCGRVAVGACCPPLRTAHKASNCPITKHTSQNIPVHLTCKNCSVHSSLLGLSSIQQECVDAHECGGRKLAF